MIFKTIQIENFRQYRGPLTIDFSTDENAVTLLVARNGVGKTTLLQAFRFCLYGESPNYVKLPDPEHLLSNSTLEGMKPGDHASSVVALRFSHAGENYVLRRTLNFVRYGTSAVKQGTSNLTMMRETGSGFTQVEDPDRLISQMLPAGLAHVYMFDGERIEQNIRTNEFKSDLQEAITGVLGLKRLSNAEEIIGTRSKTSALIGRVNSLARPVSEEERNFSKNESNWRAKIAQNDKEIEAFSEVLDSVNEKIKSQEYVLSQKQDVKLLHSNKKNAEEKAAALKHTRAVLNTEGIDLETRALLLLEIEKHHQEYNDFVAKKRDDGEVFESLHESVIDAIRQKGYCICGRPVEEHSPEMKKLLSLATLPHDNAVFVTSMNHIFQATEQLPILINRIKQIRVRRIELLPTIRKEEAKAEKLTKQIIKAENINDGLSVQYDIEKLRRTKYNAEENIESLKKKNEGLNSSVGEISQRLKVLRSKDETNERVEIAMDDLGKVATHISTRLTLLQARTHEAVQNNMNKIVQTLMGSDKSVELKRDYELKVYSNSNNGRIKREETALSTGQNVMISLAFLRSLLASRSEVAEDLTDEKSGVVMDAALSNVDEKFIDIASRTILTKFDQLIFMSFKRQIRNELYDGINKNIKKAYELKKDEEGNVSVTPVKLSSLKKYINTRDEEDAE